MKNQKITAVALLLGVTLAEIADLQQKTEEGLLNEEEALMELEHIAAHKDLSQLEEEIDLADKQNFDYREFPTHEEYVAEQEESFGPEDEDNDYALIELNEHQQLTEEPLSDSDSLPGSDDEDLQIQDDESLAEEEDDESASSSGDSGSDEDEAATLAEKRDDPEDVEDSDESKSESQSLSEEEDLGIHEEDLIMNEEDMIQYQNDDSIEQDVDDEADSLAQCGDGDAEEDESEESKSIESESSGSEEEDNEEEGADDKKTFAEKLYD